MAAAGRSATESLQSPSRDSHCSIVLSDDFYALQEEVGKGAFQELDQVAAARQLTKYAARATSAAEVPRIVREAFEVCLLRLQKHIVLAPGVILCRKRAPQCAPQKIYGAFEMRDSQSCARVCSAWRAHNVKYGTRITPLVAACTRLL